MIILYIGNVGYPDTASSIHVRNRAIFMKSCGHEVHVLCELASDGKRMEEVDEVTYQYMDPYPGRGKVRGAFWNLDQVFGKFYFKQTQKYLDKIKPDIIILYEPNSILYVLKMLNLSKKEGLPSVLIILMLVMFFFAPAQDFWLLRQRYEYKYKLAGALTMGSALASTIFSVIVVLYLNKAGSDQVVVGRLYATNIATIVISAVIWIKIYAKGKTTVNIKYWKYSLKLAGKTPDLLQV